MTTDVGFPAAESVRPSSAEAWADGQPSNIELTLRREVPATWLAQRSDVPRTDFIGQMLIGGACLLLTGLAAAMGITSFHAQFTYIFATKRQWAPSLLEALGLDAGAVIFSLLGIALARMGRRAAVERVLVVICALGSCAMNVLNANLGSPRSVAVYAMPPVLFALTSDRLIAVVRRAALGKAADDNVQRSAWYLVSRSLLYGLRFAVDRRGTAAGLRQAILHAAPLPQTALPAASEQAPTCNGTEGAMAGAPAANRNRPWADTATEPGGEGGEEVRARSPRKKGTKTERFLTLTREAYGPLSEFDLANVYKVSAELAPKVRLNTGSARAALRSAVQAAQDSSR